MRAAYGTSIPHLDPGDVADFPVVRLGSKLEKEIADLAETSVRARTEADAVERKIAEEASEIIENFVNSRPAVSSPHRPSGVV